MKRKLSAVEARKKFGELLEEVYYRGDEVVIERAGKPMAVVIPERVYREIQEGRKRARERMWELIQKTWERNKDLSPEEMEEIDKDVEEAIREVRSGRKLENAG